MIDLTKIIKPFREARGWTKRELANRADVSHNTVYSVETGRHSASITIAQLILEQFGLDMVVIYEGDTDLIRRSDVLEVLKYWKDLEAYERIIDLPSVVVE